MALLAMVAAVATFVVGATASVRAASAPAIYMEVERVPPRPAAVVFGAFVTPNGEPCAVLAARVRAAVALYRAGKVRKLLMTGDHGRESYDEPTAMKRYAVSLGVPARDVVRDYAGFRTLDSCCRARRVFGVERAVLVTQAYHLPRALFTARQVGIDAVGFAARPDVPDSYLRAFERREWIATPMAVLDVSLLRRQPRFLGRPEPVFENERDDR